MADSKSFLAEEFGKFCEAAWLDLPAAAAERLLGAGNEEDLRKAGWKAYDAWVGLANEFTNRLYSNRMVGEVTGSVMESGLRLRQASGAVMSAMFGNLWPAIGLPTRDELTALRDDLAELRNDLASYAMETRIAPAPRLDSAAHPADGGLRLIRKSLEANGSRSINGDAGAYRSSREGKAGVAA
ncbi:MAG TPA: hypothetical protein VJN94_00965 [Candidatus Binataceae bacterium]|nr:hypothetical protein [Candidatus Binataceae bacterium]